MEYIKIDDKTVIGYDLTKRTCYMFNPSELAKEKTEAETKVASIPTEPTDKQLLDWAKSNYPKMDYTKERQFYLDKISLADEVLSIK